MVVSIPRKEVRGIVHVHLKDFKGFYELALLGT